MGLGAHGPTLAWLLSRLLSRQVTNRLVLWGIAVLLAAMIASNVLYLATRAQPTKSSVFDVNYTQAMNCLGERWDPFDPNKTFENEVRMLRFCVTLYPHSLPAP